MSLALLVPIQPHAWLHLEPATVSTFVRPSISRLTSIADLRDIDLDFIRQNALAIMRQSPVEYIQNARLVGSLFNRMTLDGSVSSADTGFFVDHAEPLQTLDGVRSTSHWPLGDLLEGHEFIMLTRVR